MCGESPQGMFSTFSLLPAREQFLSGCGPHIFFLSCKRKRAGHGTKEKALRDELPGKAVNSPKTGGWPSQTADQIQKSPTGCADRHTSKNCVPAFGGVAFIGLQNRT